MGSQNPSIAIFDAFSRDPHDSTQTLSLHFGGAGLAGPGRLGFGPSTRTGQLAQCVIRPYPRVVCRVQRCLCQTLESPDRPRREHQAVAWRLGQTSPLGDRRHRRRRGHAGLGRGHRCLGQKRWAHSCRLAKALAPQLGTVHLHHRVGGAPGQPQRHQRLGQLGQARHQCDHTQPQNLGRRTLELLGRVGICQTQIRR